MSKEFWIDTALRCVWTFAEAMLGFLTIGQALTDVSWAHAFSVSAVAMIICLLKQIVVITQLSTKVEYMPEDKIKEAD